MVQVLTGSHDCTIRLWDLAAGKTKAVLTNHKKSVRALAMHPSESVHYIENTSVHLPSIFCRGRLFVVAPRALMISSLVFYQLT